MTEIIQDDLRVEGKLEVIGNQDTAQVVVQSNTTQTTPLQKWQLDASTPLAQIDHQGKLQIGSFESGALATDDSHIEVYRDEDDTAKPKRGLHVMGAIKDALTQIVSWSVHELVLKGTQGVQALHTALRVNIGSCSERVKTR